MIFGFIYLMAQRLRAHPDFDPAESSVPNGVS